MPQYILYLNRRKRHEETLREYYSSITLGAVEAPTNIAALKAGRVTYGAHPTIYLLDVVSFKRAPEVQQRIAQKAVKA